MKRYCLALDLIDDAEKMAAYEEWHRQVWPEILESIAQAGIQAMTIFRTGNRLCMIMETTDEFSFEKKAAQDAANSKVQEWEKLMWQYQQAIPGSKPGEKWRLMQPLFEWQADVATHG